MAEDAFTKESLILMLRMKHDHVLRSGKPRIGQVFPDGQVDLIIEITPTPSKLWWDCLTGAAGGTVLEGRFASSGMSAIAVQSTEDELEADVRRVVDLLNNTNVAYDGRFDEARSKLDAINNRVESGNNPEERQRKLEERLKNY